MDGIFGNLPEIHTARLVLRKICLSDAADMFEYARQKKVTKYTIWDSHRSVNDTKAFIKSATARARKGLPVSWAMELKSSGRVIGTAGIEAYSRQHRTASIGYAMSPEHWNKGLMTEAVVAVISFAFKKLGANRVEAVCDVKNAASARVMEKAGMKFEGIQRSRIITARGRLSDVKSYAITGKDGRK
jgi:ribosomal-protein-alanine N-acetyltransferase